MAAGVVPQSSCSLRPQAPASICSLMPAGLLVLPPLLIALSVAALPWIYPVEMPIAQPSREMGPFFADSFQRRTEIKIGKKLMR